MVGPTIARPGSIEMIGKSNFNFAHSSLITLAKAGRTDCGEIAFSEVVYAIPYPPPTFNSGNALPNFSLISASVATNRWAAKVKPVTSKICEPIWQ